MQNKAEISIIGGEREENSAPVAASQSSKIPAATGPGSTLLAGGSGVVPQIVLDKLAQSVGKSRPLAPVGDSSPQPGEKIVGPDQPQTNRGQVGKVSTVNGKAYVENVTDRDR